MALLTKTQNQWYTQTLAMGTRYPEETLTSQAPPPHFNLLLRFWPLHFANMIKLFKFCRKKKQNGGRGTLPSEEPPNFEFQFCPQISASSFSKYDETFL